MATARKRTTPAPAPSTRTRGTRRRSARLTNPPDPAAVLAKINALHKRPWEVVVDVYLTAADPPGFSLETCLEVNSSNRIMFRNKRRPGFIIKFRLHNELNPTWFFPSVPADAVWSRKGFLCPDQVGIWEVLEPYEVDGTRLNLLVYNENPAPKIGSFQFNLRVTKDNGANFHPLDPGGGDQNGPAN